MKRFYDKLKNNYGSISVDIPSGDECIITCNDIKQLDYGSFCNAHFYIYVNGKLLSTISCRWNWDDFIKEYKL